MAAEGILVNGVTEVLKKLIPVVAQEIGFSWGVKDDLKKLQETLEMILAVVSDAERKQVTENAVRLWLRWLKDVSYDADDVMDEFSYESMRRSVRGNKLKDRARDFVSSANPLAFRFKIARKIKHINRRLDEITKDMSRFHLQTTPAILPGESSEQRSRQTASSVNESCIIGREDEKERIINMLTEVTPSSSDSNTEKISVISIVGMGGLGKTTLAQLVYKDKMVNELFDLTMWVHVSEDFDVEKLLTKIMESSTLNKFDTPSNFAVLVSKVQEQLNGKRYLLVLDDLWNENAEEWERLYGPLLVGAQGSKILITTRKTQVADVIKGSISPYQLEKLHDDECWSIIEKRAFSPGGAVQTANMTRIGREIAKKCSGLPLAAKFLGGLMRSKNEEVNWLYILENDVWNAGESKCEIRSILKLSYDNLSPHLKQCFSYCSIFPKDWEINRVTLVHLWMAEGFLDTCNMGYRRSIEDIADEYFENLIWSSFLDGVQESSLGDVTTCKMHDLVHDLAKAVAGDQEYSASKVSEFDISFKIRRLQLTLDVDLSSTHLKSLDKLRTLIIPEGSNLIDPLIFSENNHMRVLHVGCSPYNSARRKWPSLSVPKHLRYLRLSFLDLREIKNDLSIGKLYNLETLILTNSYSVQNHLSNIQSLQKLRYLELSFTDMAELPDSITSLSNLQTLDLNNCELKVIPDSISGLKNLRFLNLSFNPIEELPVSILTLSNLETLDVNTCQKLKSLPQSVTGLTKLRIFDFKNCELLEALPIDIGTLTQLRYLSCDGTRIMAFPESCSNLNNLEYLNLHWCRIPKYVKNLTKLRAFYSKTGRILGVRDLVCLKMLRYAVPALYINDPECNFGIDELRNLNFLEVLSIWDLQNVLDPMEAERANLKGKLNLRELCLEWDQPGWSWNSSNHLQVFESLKPPSGLRELQIQNFMGRVFPKWMCVPSSLPNLVRLDLDNCGGIKELPEIVKTARLRCLCLTEMHLESLDIGEFPSLIELVLTDMFLLEELVSSYPSGLQKLWINGCKSLTETPSFGSLAYLKLQNVDSKLVCSAVKQTSLKDLRLENIKELVYFPISILQKNSNLQFLQIERCDQLECFGVNGDDKNEDKVVLNYSKLYSGSLQTLEVYDCLGLKFLPDLRGWTSLRSLTFFNCPQVKESLTYDLKSLSFLNELWVDFIQRDDQRGDPSTLEGMINLINKS